MNLYATGGTQHDRAGQDPRPVQQACTPGDSGFPIPDPAEGKTSKKWGCQLAKEYIKIKNWSAYQHYKDRNPPWIKLHQDLIASRAWVCLDDASRVLAVAIMLLASRTDNHIPWDPSFIRRVAYLNSDPDILPLVGVDFVELVTESGLTCDASNLLAICLQDASPEESRGETETEGEGEGEGDKGTGRPQVSPAEFLSAWNSQTTLPKIRKMTKGRKGQLKTRCNDPEFVINWQEAVTLLSQSPFHTGENDRDWRADVDWFLKNDKNWLKIMERKEEISAAYYRRLQQDSNGQAGGHGPGATPAGRLSFEDQESQYGQTITF